MSQISAGGWTAYAQLNSGTVTAWGSNLYFYELASAPASPGGAQTTPVAVLNLPPKRVTTLQGGCLDVFVITAP